MLQEFTPVAIIAAIAIWRAVADLDRECLRVLDEIDHAICKRRGVSPQKRQPGPVRSPPKQPWANSRRVGTDTGTGWDFRSFRLPYRQPKPRPASRMVFRLVVRRSLKRPGGIVN